MNQFKKIMLYLSRILSKGAKEIDYSRYFSIDNTSILTKGKNIDFRTSFTERTYVQIGEYCLINSVFTFETCHGKIEIGKNVHIGFAHFICKNHIKIGDDVTMAWNITLYDHDSHSIFWEERKNDNIQCYKDYMENTGNNIVNKDWKNVKSAPIEIGSKVWIGFGVTILKGVKIGEGAVVAAMSVVTKDVPAWTMVAGNPATIKKRIE